MRRGDLVTVALSGDYGKPRPALIIQSDLVPGTGSVLVCLITTTDHPTPLYRLQLRAGAETGLREPSWVMADKIFAVRRDRCGDPIGRVDAATMTEIGRRLAVMIGIAD